MGRSMTSIPGRTGANTAPASSGTHGVYVHGHAQTIGHGHSPLEKGAGGETGSQAGTGKRQRHANARQDDVSRSQPPSAAPRVWRGADRRR